MRHFAILGRVARLLLCAPLLCVAACHPMLITHDGAHIRYQPPALYYMLFSLDRDCTAEWVRTQHPNAADSLHSIVYTDSLDDIIQVWIRVDGGAIYDNTGLPAGQSAAATTKGDTIEVGSTYLYDQGIIRHEEIHALQEVHPELLPGNNWHDPSLFNYCHVPLTAG